MSTKPVQEKLLTEPQAAEVLNFTARTLQAWRVRGGGPPYVKISARAIRYRQCDLNRWIEQRIRSSTSDPGPASTRRTK